MKSRNSHVALAVFAALLAGSASLVASNIPANFTRASDIALTSPSYVASGNTIQISLQFVPVPGTPLTLIRNTGSGWIQGRFENLDHGAEIPLVFSGNTYRFVANYHGGASGRDLVLQWAGARPAAWGANSTGQLGSNSPAQNPLPAVVNSSGPLAGKTVLRLAAGRSHNLALCSDGTMAAWGSNAHGQLGNGGTSNSAARVAVDASGILQGKMVVGIAAGSHYNLALCSDGTLAAWGNNQFGQLGDGSVTNSATPVAVDRSGALAGKSVVAISAGDQHSLALCSDGTVFAWGYNAFGQLGNNSSANSSTPVAVEMGGPLAGKSVVGIAAGAHHNLALCSDGTVASWGANWYGGLGNGAWWSSPAPVPVSPTGALAEKTVTAIAAGGYHSLALCSDGTVAGWGYNGGGALGNGSTNGGPTPVTLNMSGPLSGKTVADIAAGAGHSLAYCLDGTITAWGYNLTGALGNGGSTNATTPTALNVSAIPPAVHIATVCSGPFSTHSLGLAASLVPEPVLTNPPTTGGTVASLFNFTISANGTVASYGAAGLPPGLSLNATTGVISGTPTQAGTYAVTLSASNEVGTVTQDIEITLSKGPATASLSGGLSVNFDTLPKPVAVTTVPAGVHVDVTYNGSPIAPSAPGSYAVVATINDPNYEGSPATGTLIIAPANPVVNLILTSISTAPISSSSYFASGATLNLSLGFAPPTGVDLPVIKSTSSSRVGGEFSNLAHGQTVSMTYGGKIYHYVANYAGGNGLDLVLQWADVRPFAWGLNDFGQFGTGDTNDSLAPIPVATTGILAGKTVIQMAAQQENSAFLCSDGKVYMTGLNSSGQLGDGTNTSSSVPVAVDASGVLAGKTVVRIALGSGRCFALCSDGTLVGWGQTYANGTNGSTSVPIALNGFGVLAGKTVTTITTGGWHVLALCSDGTVCAWGFNSNGQLGNNSTTTSYLPVLVDASGVLVGKSVMSIGAANYHSFALCSDGTLAMWGRNVNGQLGIGSFTNSLAPVTVPTNAGALTGKTVVDVAVGGEHSIVRCSDGTMFAWGANWSGQLGTSSTDYNRTSPTAVLPGVLAGKTIVRIQAGSQHSLAVGSDGTLAAWGDNSYGQLGINSTVTSNTPVGVNKSNLAPNEVFTHPSLGATPQHSLGLAATPAAP